ncbi:MAG TPA: tetratricopeptide repeat protein [Ktedonobacteraceae bacterium]|jgi:tetratricopeptide (TPR) repeat protein|nr:tetratricopeptide repeat protein [Ktedonobacteraceae bacterium]
MSHKDHKAKDQAQHMATQADTTQVQAQLANYQAIADQLNDNDSPDQDQESLESILTLDVPVQIAYIQALVKEKNTAAADILQAINNYASAKDVRKEARRSLIKLESISVYPEWTPPVISLVEPMFGKSASNQDESMDDDLFSFLPPELANLLPSAQHESIVRDFLLSWADGDYKTAYNNLASDSPIREGLTRQQWVKRRQQWAEQAQPKSFKALSAKVHDENNDPSATTLEMSWSLIFHSDTAPDSEPLPELPATTLLYPDTQRHWCWATYTFVREDDKLRIYDFVDEGAHALQLPDEVLQQRIDDFTKQADEELKALQEAQDNTEQKLGELTEPQDEEDEEDEDEEDWDDEENLLDDSLTDMMMRAGEAFYAASKALHYRDAMLARSPQDATLYDAGYDLATLMMDEERAAAYMQLMAEHVPSKRAEALQKLASALVLATTHYDDEEDEDENEEKIDLFLQRAEETLREAITISNDSFNLVMLAQVLITKEENETTEAEDLLQKALASNPDERTATLGNVSMGRIEQGRDNHRKALPYYEEAARISPDFPNIWTHLGLTRIELEQIDEAEQNLLHAVELDSEDTSAYSGLAFLYTIKKHDLNRAEEVLEEGLEFNPGSAELLIALTKVDIEKGDLEAAEENLSEAEEVEPDNPFIEETRMVLDQLKALRRGPKRAKHKQTKRKR